MSDSISSNSPSPQDLGPADGDQAPSGQEVLLQVKDALVAIGRGSTDERMQEIYRASVDHHHQISQILEVLPSATIRPILECVLQICDSISGLPGPQSASLCRVARHLGADPRSYREAARTLEVIAGQIQAGSQLDISVGKALSLLDQRGVVGHRRMLELSRFFVGLSRRPGTLTSRGSLIRIADEDLILSDLADYHASLLHHSPLWGPQAAALALYPETQSFGATLVLEKVKTPLSKTLTVDYPSAALIPGRTVQQRWVRIDPIPATLKTEDPIKDMAPYVELRGPDWKSPENAHTLDVVYAGVRVAMSIVQPLWLSRLRLGVRMMNSRGNKACYSPQRAEIYIWKGPLSAWSVVHEMAHAIDDVLVEGPGFASEQPGNPLHAFTTMMRPHYRNVAEKRAKVMWSGMLKSAFAPDIGQRLQQGLVPLQEAVEGLPWLNAEEKVRVLAMLLEEMDIGTDQVRKALGEDHLLHGGETPLLNMLAESIVEDTHGESFVNIALGWESFRHAELQYLLSDKEIFARFFDQYARLYLAQLGAPYGPAVRPGDLEPQELAPLVGAFHKAMVDAQVLDLGHVYRYSSKSLQEDTILSLGMAAGLVAIGAGFISVG